MRVISIEGKFKFMGRKKSPMARVRRLKKGQVLALNPTSVRGLVGEEA